jgi:hypothetical protein
MRDAFRTAAGMNGVTNKFAKKCLNMLKCFWQLMRVSKTTRNFFVF